MALFAPGYAAGVVQGLDAYTQRMGQQQQQAERAQLMQQRAYELEQARAKNANDLRANEYTGGAMHVPAPGQASVPMQVPQSQPQFGGVPAPAVNGVQSTPVRQAPMPQGTPLPPMGQGQQPIQQIPRYTTVQGLQQAQGLAAPGVQPASSPGMAQVPSVQPQGGQQGPQLEANWTNENILAYMDNPGDGRPPVPDQLRPIVYDKLAASMGNAEVQRNLQKLTLQRQNEAEADRKTIMGYRANADARAAEAAARSAKKASSSSGYQIPEEMRDTHGADYLSSLPATDAAIVKAISDGRESPASLGYRGQQRKDTMTMVNQYNPNYQEFAFKSKAGVQKDFTSGPAARNVTSINTAIGHLGSLDALGKAVQTGDVKKINQAVNTIANETGNPKINNMQLAAQAVGDELMRTFRQVGASESEALQWQQKFSSANSPEQMSGAIKTAAALLDSRIKALNDQWKRGMDTEQGFPNLLSPSSKKAMQSMGIDVGDGSDTGGASGAPKVGTVDSGYRFKGGDPSDKNNWVKQ